MNKLNFGITLLLISLSLIQISCNLFGGADTPKETRDIYLDALAKANSGDCDTAVRMLSEITSPDDDIWSALGWGQLCQAGVKSSDIAKSIYSYSGTTSSNLTVVGSLAKVMIPYNSSKAGFISLAISSFSNISNTSKKNIQQAIARFVKAAAILAEQATNSNGADLEKADIGPASGCDGVSCPAAATCTAGMSDAKVTEFLNEISSAATLLSSSGATELKNLATTLNSGLGAGGQQGRCYIYQNTIPQ